MKVYLLFLFRKSPKDFDIFYHGYDINFCLKENTENLYYIYNVSTNNLYI